MSAVPSSALRTSWRDRGSTLLVVALSSAFGVGLLQIVGLLSSALRNDDVTGASGTVSIMLSIIAFVFIVIAVYVGAIVTANTVATVVAGRVRSIAMLRLLGSTARSQRIAIAREGLVTGTVGTAIGALVGTGAVVGIEQFAIQVNGLRPTGYTYVDGVLLLPIAAVILTTWLASWVGSRRVLSVSPMQALRSAEEFSADDVAARTAPRRVAIVLAVIGVALLAAGVAVGLVNPLGGIIGLFGGVFSFTAIVLSADVIMPPALRLSGRLLGRSVPARLAAENALRQPQRSARATIGLVIGVTLITMFGVAVASFQVITDAARAAQPDTYQGIDEVLAAIVAIFSSLIGFSAIIAAIGLVNTLSLSVLQRTRELGLLRALGLSTKQLRAMVLAEAAQLSLTAVVVGLILGTAYGWVGAQSLFGSIAGSPGVVMPGIPWVILGAVAVAGALLALLASWAPSRRATRVAPVTALAVE